MMLITPYYAAVFGLVFVLLSFRVIRIRQHLGVAIGDGDNPGLRRAIRAHGNFIEYVPFALLLIFFVELRYAQDLIVHLLGLSLLVARMAHAYGVSQRKENLRFRVFGLSVTGLVFCTSALLIWTNRL